MVRFFIFIVTLLSKIQLILMHRKPPANRKPKVLFLVKRKNDSAGYSTFESGLHNSCKLLLEALFNHRLIRDGKIVVCADANQIDREVFLFKPDICVIEAIWVTPTKMREIQRLHRHVKFVVRVHSNIPFLATEGNAVEWLKGYETIPHVTVAFNNKNTAAYLAGIFIKPIYLPNIYEAEFSDSNAVDGELNIACFGAIRPLKNQLLQAVAAVQFANIIGVNLKFHINSQRIEQHGEGVVKNMRALFVGTKHELIEHKWLKHDDFLALIKTMDCGLQVSFTESFNIIAADFIYSGVPIIVSTDISWMTDRLKVDPNNVFEIVNKLSDVIVGKKIYLRRAKKSLIEYNVDSVNTWANYLLGV